MKISTLVLFFITVLSSVAFSAETTKPSKGSVGGWRESYGGDATILEFKYHAKEVVYILKINNFASTFNFNQQTFSDVIDSANVVCAKDLMLDGVVKDAINYPFETPQRIMLNCEEWGKFSSQEKYMLAIHEFLPLSGIDDTSYQYTSEIYTFFNIYKFSYEENASKLTNIVFDCNKASFDDYISKKGNIFLLSRLGANALHTATVANCSSIIKKLIDMRLSYQYSSELSAAAHYPLIQYAFNSNEKNFRENTVVTLKLLIDAFPALVDMGFENLNWTSNFDFDELAKSCYKDSTVMHLIATGCNANPIYCDKSYIRSLVNLGFSLDKKNACGQTPRSLFKQADVVLE